MRSAALEPRRTLARLRGAVLDVRRHLVPFVAFEIGIAIIWTMLLLPIASWCLDRLVETTGRVAVSNFEIADFILSPAGIVAIAIVGGSFLTSRFLHEGLLVATLLQLSGSSSPVATALVVARRLPRLALLGLLELALLALVALPFLGAALLAGALLLGPQDINYYLATNPPAFRAFLIIVLVLGALSALVFWAASILWCFAITIALTEEVAPLAALRRSMRLAWRTRVTTTAALTAHLLLGVAGAVGLVGLVHMAGVSILERTATGTTSVVVVVGLLVTAEATVAGIVAFLSFGVRGALIVRLYEDAVGRPHVASPPPRRSALLRARRVALLSLALLVAGATVTAVAIARDADPNVRTLIVAHRGASTVAPENTLGAIDAAIELGADVVEIDVQETSDGRLVVLHDKDLMRVAGDPRAIWDLTLDDVRAIDVGSWFDESFADERVPTLGEAIERVRGRGRLLIELKYNGHDVDLAGRVVNVVREADFTPHCMIMTLDSPGLDQVRARAPEIKLGLTIAKSIGDLRRADVDFLSLSADRVTRRLVGRARLAGKGVQVWTVNDEAGMRRFLALGVDGIITDDVEMAVRVRDEYDDMTLVERLLLAHRYRIAH